MSIFDSHSRKREKLLAQQRYHQAQEADFGNEGFQKAPAAIEPLDVKGAAAAKKTVPAPQAPADFRNDASFVDVRQAKSNASSRTRKVVSAVLMAVSLCIFVFFAGRLVKTYLTYRSCDQTAEGKTTAYFKPDSILAGKNTMFAEIEFASGDGSVYKHLSTCEVGSYPYREGVSVRIKYNRLDPGVSTFEVEFHNFLARTIVIMCVCLLVAVIAWLLRPRLSEEV